MDGSRFGLPICAIAGVSAWGCKDSVACEKARLGVHRSWDALLESAFATERVTWDSAKKKIEELKTSTGEATTSGPGAGIQGFVAQVDEATRSQNDMERKCR